MGGAGEFGELDVSGEGGDESLLAAAGAMDALVEGARVAEAEAGAGLADDQRLAAEAELAAVEAELLRAEAEAEAGTRQQQGGGTSDGHAPGMEV